MDEKPFTSLLSLAFARGALLRLTASKPSDAALPVRQSGRMAKHGNDVFLTVESVLTGGRVIHRHYKAAELSALLDELGIYPCSFSKYGKCYTQYLCRRPAEEFFVEVNEDVRQYS